MSNKSNIYGKAYEYACVLALLNSVSKLRAVEVIQNRSLEIAKSRFEDNLTAEQRDEMMLSACAGIEAIIEMEPKIIERAEDVLEISLQPDSVAQKFGDIRDLLVIRSGIDWEVGISVKHNHSALKHSRLSAKLDFGEVWLGIPCSEQYFCDIAPVFDKLSELKKSSALWAELPSKADEVYVPILNAFREEFLRIDNSQKIIEVLMAYLIGSNGKDYYKLIHNSDHTTSILPFNIFGTLNENAENSKPLINVPKIKLPTRIIEMEYKEKSKTTLILTMDSGWSVSFRIHSASSKVEASLKFDIQLQSKPEDILYVKRSW